jgi:hypothetical protein
MNADGTLQSVISTGGGWGHNVGMSQYGAHGRGLAGQTFLQILKTYYTGVDIGTYPIRLRPESAGGPSEVTQMFNAPSSQATLVARGTPDLKVLRVVVNDKHEFLLENSFISEPVVAIDLTGYIEPGLNTVWYEVTSNGGNAVVNVNVNESSSKGVLR